MGYHRDSKQSAIAIKFLRWLENETGWQIQHRDSALGEHRFRGANGQIFLLDGFVRRHHHGLPDVAIEFLGNLEIKLSIKFKCIGCAWHGHDCCYEPDEICLNGKTAALNLEMVESRRRELVANGLTVYMVWECHVLEEMSQNPEMMDFMDTVLCWSPLLPRDGFFGYSRPLDII